VHDHAHFERLHYRAFVERPGYRMMRPLPGAVTALRTLYEHGYLIRILTGRLWTAGLAARVLGDTGFWVEANEIPADDIAFVTDKASVHADFYVEDGPHFLTALHSLQRRVIVFDQPYNQHSRGPRARSWEEVVRLVEQEAGEGTG
jgi:5'(3')-deoxyribonucleotidase